MTGAIIAKTASPRTLAFLQGGGEMGERMRTHDWTGSPLGPPDGWPLPLRTMLRLLLNTGHPMYIWWGADLFCFYNDAYRQSIGPERHPSSLGRPAREVWAEIWDIIGPQIEQVMSGGGPTWHENALVPITRNGQREGVYWTYSYSPIDDPEAPSGVGGVLVTCTETTRVVLAERRRAEEAARQRRLFEQAPGFIIIMRGPDLVVEFVNDVHRAGFGSDDWIGRPIRDAFPSIAGQGFFEVLDDVFATGATYQANEAPVTYQRAPDEAPATRYLTFIYAPLVDEDGIVDGIFCEGFDVTAAHQTHELAERQRQHLQLLVDELNHRVKNTLAIVQGLSQQTFRELPQAAGARDAFEGRLVALASAHNLLTEQRWGATDLRELIRGTLGPLSIDSDRLRLDGPRAALSPETTVSLAMVLHELGTNARKYGAWSNETGSVVLRWTIRHRANAHLELHWAESGGPPVKAPERRGFGSRLIARALADEADGSARLTFEADGVVCAIEVPLARERGEDALTPSPG
ncbi:MAG TPA: HWE histidine kinase domain-containing protein [Caulobacteraceae bacterium]|jgi:two-component sensor histidine kinase/PAS domain-containing protein|nr:HWE histidine kinase domain-containing protein [Caulobacteraceae bacterium]